MKKEIKTNKLGTNLAIQINPDYNLLKAYGFKFHDKTDIYPAYWYYYRCFEYDEFEFGFSVDYYIEPYQDSFLCINVIDEDFCQPYDYQYILEKNPNNIYAQKVQEFVENEMEKLQKAGILSGHKKGEYI